MLAEDAEEYRDSQLFLPIKAAISGMVDYQPASLTANLVYQ